MHVPTSRGWSARLRLARLSVARLGRSLQHWPWLDTLRTLRLRFRDDQLGVRASALTFTTTIALVPLVAVSFAVFTAFPMFGTFRKALEAYLLQNLVPDAIARPVLTQLTLFAGKAYRLGAVGLVFLGLTVIALLLTIDRALNAIWRVRQPRPIAQRVLVYWAIATLGPLMLGVSLSLTSYAVSVSSGWAEALPGGVEFLLDGFEFLLVVVGMACLYRYVPHTQVRWTHALAGGVFVAVGFSLAKRLLAWYLGFAPVYKTIYGAFAAVPILLVWIYLTWVIVLLGAVAAAYAPSLDMRVVRHADRPGWRYTLALTVLGALAEARSQARAGQSLAQLVQALRIDPLQLEPVLEELRAMDWIGGLDEAGEARLVLLVDPDRTRVQPLVERLLLGPAHGNRAFAAAARWQDLTLREVLPGVGA